jgi:hypothetical protein
MWEGWEKYAERDNYKSYGLLVKADVVVSLLTNLTKINLEPLIWEVEIVAFNPLAGEYTLLSSTDKFFSFNGRGSSSTINSQKEIASSAEVEGLV